MAERDFTWHDAERTIVFRPGALADSTDILAGTVWERFEVLTTTRALGAAPVDLAERASMVHQVGPGRFQTSRRRSSTGFGIRPWSRWAAAV